MFEIRDEHPQTYWLRSIREDCRKACKMCTSDVQTTARVLHPAREIVTTLNPYQHFQAVDDSVQSTRQFSVLMLPVAKYLNGIFHSRQTKADHQQCTRRRF